MGASRVRVEFGDWQTPQGLADDVVALVSTLMREPPRYIIEPTCGQGAFLVAATQRFPHVPCGGYEINPDYAAIADSRLKHASKSIRVADFFSVDWKNELASRDEPILVIGNPPWVTNAGLGTVGSRNLPEKKNVKRLRGLDAMTGKSNFDVSEWMIFRLLDALEGRTATLAVLCKSAVARKVIEGCVQQNRQLVPGGMWRIDADKHFQAAVDAVLFVCHTGPQAQSYVPHWPVHAALHAQSPETCIGFADGQLIADLDAHARSRSITGPSKIPWRSGIKHDCAGVMELADRGQVWINGLGETVDIEADYLFPLLKSSDVANGRCAPRRAVIVPQKSLSDDTRVLQTRAPKLWAYLEKHAERLQQRKSSIYNGKPPFAIFGVGDYSFAPWKVAISGLYKQLRFRLIGPHEGQPVMLDDTCYFLPFFAEDEARCAAEALESGPAQDYFRARIFWDAKRPVTKAILQNLDLNRLLEEVGILALPGSARSCPVHTPHESP